MSAPCWPPHLGPAWESAFAVVVTAQEALPRSRIRRPTSRPWSGLRARARRGACDRRLTRGCGRGAGGGSARAGHTQRLFRLETGSGRAGSGSVAAREPCRLATAGRRRRGAGSDRPRADPAVACRGRSRGFGSRGFADQLSHAPEASHNTSTKKSAHRPHPITDSSGVSRRDDARAVCPALSCTAAGLLPPGRNGSQRPVSQP